MGAVDLVIQIEAPPQSPAACSASAEPVTQSTPSAKVFFFRSTARPRCLRRRHPRHARRHIESTRFPRNPLDVLCQQVVAICAQPPHMPKALRSTKPRRIQPSTVLPPDPKPEVSVDFLYDLVRRAAPFGGLTRSSFEGVLDLLSGRYPSDEFAELRPRLTWDRIRNVVTARDGAARLAIPTPAPSRPWPLWCFPGPHGRQIRPRR